MSLLPLVGKGDTQDIDITLDGVDTFEPISAAVCNDDRVFCFRI